MNNEPKEREVFVCPVGRFFAGMERRLDRKSMFFSHINRSRIEFLKALRSLVDGRIEELEKRTGPRSEKTVTRVEVE